MAADGCETHVFIMADFPQPPFGSVHPFPPPTDEIKTPSTPNEKGTAFAGKWENISALIGPEK